MIRQSQQIITFLAVWFCGMLVFEAWLRLQGGWMMLAGVATFLLAGWAAGMVTVTFKEKA